MQIHVRWAGPRLALALLAGSLCAGRAMAQTVPPEKQTAHVKVAIIPARPEDVSTIEAIVKADYECISGGVGVPRQWARDLTLYDPHARFYSPHIDAKTGKLVVWSPSSQEYTDASDESSVKTGFTEHEIAHKIVRYGNVATVFSSAEGKLAGEDKAEWRGVNIYQLYFAGGRWWITSVSWDAEKPDNPIPPELAAQP